MISPLERFTHSLLLVQILSSLSSWTEVEVTAFSPSSRLSIGSISSHHTSKENVPSASSYRPFPSLCILNANKQPFFADEVATASSSLPDTSNVDASTTSSGTTTSTLQRDRPQEIFNEANDALTSVGWSTPMTAEELTSDDPFVQSINASIQKESGVALEELLNPAKVVNLERDLVNLRAQLAALTGNTQITNFVGVTTEEVDNGGGGQEADKVRKQIEKKERDLNMERRAVFRGWLKNVFLGQAILSLGLSWVMVNDPNVLFGQFDWFRNTRSMDVSIQVLGFWWWWLFIVPSLRSRRPKGFEKKALDIAFLGTPAISLLAPVATKDTVAIWLANLVVVMGAYGFAYVTYNQEEEQEGGDGDGSGGDGDGGKNTPSWLKFVYKSLDFGSGRERGARN
jgi:hypothetical protein